MRPTDEDFEKADALVTTFNVEESPDTDRWVGKIAQAFAEQREEHRKRSEWPTEDQFEDIILTWQRSWMDVKGTDERDRKNYFERATGIDANMRYGLAKKIVEYLSQYTPPKE